MAFRGSVDEMLLRERHEKASQASTVSMRKRDKTEARQRDVRPLTAQNHHVEASDLGRSSTCPLPVSCSPLTVSVSNGVQGFDAIMALLRKYHQRHRCAWLKKRGAVELGRNKKLEPGVKCIGRHGVKAVLCRHADHRKVGSPITDERRIHVPDITFSPVLCVVLFHTRHHLMNRRPFVFSVEDATLGLSEDRRVAAAPSLWAESLRSRGGYLGDRRITRHRRRIFKKPSDPRRTKAGKKTFVAEVAGTDCKRQPGFGWDFETTDELMV